jgi:hypothetical protein
MTEGEWRTSADPLAMLEVVLGKASPRKLRLFALACARRVEDLIPANRPSRAALEVAGRFADRRASAEELAEASRNAFRLTDTEPGFDTPQIHAQRSAAHAAPHVPGCWARDLVLKKG